MARDFIPLGNTLWHDALRAVTDSRIPLERPSWEIERAMETPLTTIQERADMLLVDAAGRRCLVRADTQIDTLRLVPSAYATPIEQLPPELANLAGATEGALCYRESALLPNALVEFEGVVEEDVIRPPEVPPLSYREPGVPSLVACKVMRLAALEERPAGVPKRWFG